MRISSRNLIYACETYTLPLESAIDLSFCDTSVFLNFQWKVDTDTHDSEHIPVILKSSINQSSDQPKRWNLNRADWDKFQSLCSQNTVESKIIQDEHPVAEFTVNIIEAAKASIPTCEWAKLCF